MGVDFHTAQICLLFRAGIKRCTFLTSRGRLADSSPAGRQLTLHHCHFVSEGGGVFSYTEKTLCPILPLNYRKRVFMQSLIRIIQYILVQEKRYADFTSSKQTSAVLPCFPSMFLTFYAEVRAAINNLFQ